MLDTQDTQPLPMLPAYDPLQETRQARYQRLKALSDLTGVRLIFVYLADERRRRKAGSGNQPSHRSSNASLAERRALP